MVNPRRGPNADITHRDATRVFTLGFVASLPSTPLSSAVSRDFSLLPPAFERVPTGTNLDHR